MILGIGTDIVEIERIRASFKRTGDRFVKRILTAPELDKFYSLEDESRAIAYLAKRFAAKEAAVKALGTGIGQGVSFQHFTVKNTSSGQPILEVDMSIHSSLNSKSRWHLSITDERHYAQAFVILESIG
ncbi:holo-ACP synthase [Marinomonas agarivorans]|nr:holo-ACP synthase [Marinomonas agarivorans]